MNMNQKKKYLHVPPGRMIIYPYQRIEINITINNGYAFVIYTDVNQNELFRVRNAEWAQRDSWIKLK